MNRKTSPLSYTSFMFFALVLTCTSVRSQIVPDSTLGAESSVVKSNTSGLSVDLIEGGATRGANLFHSFEKFSVLTGHTAFFNNASDIQNIFSRVTGGSISNIDGILKANGTANLFLLNPNGIIIGPNAQLNIGGSFLASTASSIDFADSTTFSATNAQAPPLLKVSVPIGLGFGSSPGAIRVQGTGHDLAYSLFSPIARRNSSTDLRVQPGKTLALVGGDLALEGGTITAEGGRIELGSVGGGLVSISPTPSGWSLGYGGVQNFQNIQLSQEALADASGASSGFIQVQGGNVKLTDGSVILIQNQGTQALGSISVNASDSLEVNGTSPGLRTPSILLSETVGVGNGGNIAISAQRLAIQNGGAISTKTFNQQMAGNIIVKAPESLKINGFSPVDFRTLSGIGTYTFGLGKAGNVEISTGQLSVIDGATVISSTFSFGQGGNLTINANAIEITGLNPNTSGPSSLQSSTFSSGESGELTIDTSRLVLNNGGQISSSTFATGDAGGITINASDSLEISNASGVISSAIKLGETLERALQLSLPPTLSGNSGGITINARQLNLTNNGLISVSNQGVGDAGRLQVNANFVTLDNESATVAVTTSGKGGNIQLQTDNLQLRHNSSITASAVNPENNVSLLPVNAEETGNNSPVAANAESSSNGGNITISTGTLVALKNSDITANAQGGTGGQVTINAQGIFRSPDSDITATSEAGPQFSGTVEINTLDTDPSRALVTLPTQPVDATGLIAQGCAGSGGNVGTGASEFIVTGRGGLPPYQPGEPLSAEALIDDENRLETGVENRLAKVASAPSNHSTDAMLVEAQGWVINAQGQVVLTAQPPSATPYSSASTQTTCYVP